MGTGKLRRTLALLALIGVGGDPGRVLAQHRHHGPHEHGRGTLHLVIEEQRVGLELEVPAADIVGFEHAAKTARQRAQVDQAKKRLLAPQALFTFPDAAGCALDNASVDFEAQQDHDRTTGSASGRSPEAAEGRHSNVQAQYAFTCQAPARITSLDFGYFRAFPGAHKLEVSVVTPKGQKTFEATRAKPRVNLGGAL
jgi:hypothetical protein